MSTVSMPYSIGAYTHGELANSTAVFDTGSFVISFFDIHPATKFRVFGPTPRSPRGTGAACTRSPRSEMHDTVSVELCRVRWEDTWLVKMWMRGVYPAWQTCGDLVFDHVGCIFGPTAALSYGFTGENMATVKWRDTQWVS